MYGTFLFKNYEPIDVWKLVPDVFLFSAKALYKVNGSGQHQFQCIFADLDLDIK